MNTLYKKAIRDLFSDRFRSVSIIAALALGIAGFFMVLSTYSILTRALNDGYSATNPASATLIIDRLDDEAVRAVAAMSTVQGAEARRTVSGRIKTGSAPSQNLTLFVRRDFEASHIGTIARQSGAWPSGVDDIAIERDALQVARAHVGDSVSVRTRKSSQPRMLRVSASVHDVGQAQARMENIVYGYVTLEALATLGEEPYYDELAIRVAERPLDEGHIHEVANAVKKTIERSGHHVLRINVPEPGQHPHAKIMGMLMLSLAIFGFLILALSGVIVFNVLTALLVGQARQIGVMAAVGGTRFQIARVYLLEAGLLGAAAVAVALPIGILGGRWLCRWTAVFLNFDIASFAVPFWCYAVVFVAGVIVPVIAATIPVWLGTRVPVREALTPSGSLERAYGFSIVDRALASVGGSSRTLLLAIRNVNRNRTRVALTLVMLATGGIFFMSALNLRQSMVSAVDRIYAASRADISIDLASNYPTDAVERAARSVSGVTVAEGWNVVKGDTSQSSTDSGQTYTAKKKEITVIGMPAGSQVLALDIANGKGLDGSRRGFVANTALFDRLARPAIGADVHLRVEGTDVSLRLLGVASEAFSFPSAYVSPAFFNDRSNARTANSLRVSLANTNTVSIDAAKTDLESSLEREGIHTVKIGSKAESRYSFDEHMVMIYVLLIAISCILGGVGAIGLVTTVSLNVAERRREMGVLRAIGATPVRVAQIVVIEGMVVGAIAWLIATAAVIPTGKMIGDLMLRWVLRAQSEIPISIEMKGIVIWLFVSLAGSALASVWSARQAARSSVREALTYE